MRRVVKIGGSLLRSADLESRFHRWFDRLDRAETLVIVGGGSVVDEVRRADLHRPADPVEVHWRCVDLLEQTRQQVSGWTGWEFVTTKDQLLERLRFGFAINRPTLVAIRSFYDRSSKVDVPMDWSTTSDTIAAILANQVGAGELILLKSCEVNQSANLDQLSAAGIVDRALAGIAGEIPLVRAEPLP